MACRYRLYPTPEQAVVLRRHCSDARFVWNLALEQANCWSRQLGPTPSYVAQAAQLTEARAAFDWLRAGSQVIQQQALRDFDQAMKHWWNGVTTGRPRWRKAGVKEGFRQVRVRPSDIKTLNRRWATVHIPKIGPVRFRLSRSVEATVKSYRVTLDRTGRWHIAFSHKPEPIAGPGNGSVIGIDRGIAVTLTLSDGTTYHAPTPLPTRRAARRLSHSRRGSNRRRKARSRLATISARDAARRKDFVEKASTEIARSYDLIRIEDLRIVNMTRSAKGTVEKPGRNVRQKAGLNRSIRQQGWGMFATRLGHKAAGRVEKVNPAFTSQRCSACGHVDANSRESQAKFVCTACGYADNADVNAAKNIAAGHAVTARRGLGVVDLPVKREPQLAASG